MAELGNTERWGEVVELEDAGTEKATAPVVFHFRPNKFLKVAPERLEEWEEFFAENVGMRPDRDLAQRWSGDPRETISGSNNDWDDCDYW
jgi:hypothetical protein